MGSEIILTCRRVTKRFGGIVANSEIDLSIAKQTVTGLVGPNGSGKTTLLNIIAGLHRPDTGEIRFEGERISGLTSSQICRRGIARTFQTLRLFHNMTVLENVMVGAFLRSTRVLRAKDIAREMIAYVGLEEKTTDLARSLSTGQRKRLELARAMATSPNLLLLDEVLAGIDPGNRHQLVELVERLKADGLTLVIVEHDMEVIASLCTKVVALDRGIKVCEGSAADVFNDERVIASYLGSRRA